MKKYISILIVLSITVFYNVSLGQAPSIAKLIKGQILDGETDHAVEYVTIAVFKKKTEDLVTGTITAPDGRFTIKGLDEGSYYLEISFMGYEKTTINDINIDNNNPVVNLGVIKLDKAEDLIEEINVVAEKGAIDYQIDKKVVNVSKQYTTVAGTAIDVLQNVPSVTVDVEGNLSLRGSTGFTVLIDGKPSVLEGSEALDQIPASTIQNIEIITNPSVKFDPDGTAGIINVITKKNKLRGVSGIANLNLGLDEKYGGDLLLNFRKNRLDFFVGADYNDREYPGFEYSERRTLSNDTSFNILSDGTSTRKMTRWSIRSGLTFSIDSNHIVGIDARYGYYKHQGISDFDYLQNTNPSTTNFETKSFDNSMREGNFLSVNLRYTHKFAKKGHELYFLGNVSARNGDENNINRLIDNENTILDAQKSTESGPSEQWRFQLDYTLPIGAKDKFEAGIHSRTGTSNDNTDLNIYNSLTGIYESQPEYSNETEYQRTIHSVYSLYAGEIGKLGYQLGMRGEYTLRTVSSSGYEDTKIDRWDYFPTAHFSYSFSKKYQLMASYSRRIERPRSWWLEPFLTWSDAYNVRSGNPNLKPEYIDAYELNFITKMNKNFFSIETYHRVTHNHTEYVRSVYAENVILRNPENVGLAYATGAEAMFNYELFKSWQLNLSGNVYNYKVEGNLFDQDFSNESLNWNLRFNNNFNISKNIQVQVNSSYNSPTATSQGTTEDYYQIDGGIRANFLERKLSAALQVRDIFETAKRKQTIEGADFYYFNESYRKSPFVMLSLSYKFNNYRNGMRERGDMGGDDEF
jgi:outer membrane receptor protein involved in Fe transport